MTTEQPKYLIDADCIIGLQNAHDEMHSVSPPTQYIYPAAEQAAIWAGLEALAEEGRLKILPEVTVEVGRRTPEGQQCLKDLRRARVRRSRQVMEEYKKIVAEHPRWAPDPDGEDSADPWLIAQAKIAGFQILTDESPAATQSKSRAGRPKIPDVAANYGVVPKVGLRQFAKEQGWLP